MILNEDFFDDNIDSIIDSTDDAITDTKKDYQYSISIKFSVNRNHDEINQLPNSDAINKELTRLLKFIKKKYEILLTVNKHVPDFTLYELDERSWFDGLYNRTKLSYVLDIYLDIIPFNDVDAMFDFYDSLCFENYRFKADQSIRWSTQSFSTYKGKQLLGQFLGEVSFNKVSQLPRLVNELTINNDTE